MPAKQMTQKDIARTLRLSPATVSMVLRGEGRFSDEVRDRILELTRKHNVKIRERKTPPPPEKLRRLRIGYCSIHTPDWWIHSSCFRGMVEQTLIQPHEVILFSAVVEDKTQWESTAQRVKEEVLAAGLDGVIVDPSRPLIEALKALNIPVLQIGYYNLLPEGIDAVVSDNFYAGQRITQELIQRGHQRIAHITCVPTEANSVEKLGGYRMAFATAGIAEDPALVIHGSFGYLVGQECARKMLALNPRPTAVFIGNDWITDNFVHGLREHGGESVLKSIEIAHCLDTNRSSSLGYARTELRTAEMGRLAVRQLIDRIAGRAAGEAVTIKVTPAYCPAGGR